MAFVSHIRAREIILLWLLATLGLGTSAAFQRGPLTVTRGSDLRTTVKPGERVTIAFLVRNTDRSALTLVPDLSIPSGWRIVRPPKPFTLPGGGLQTITVSLSIPPAAESGSYSVAYRLTSPEYPTALAEDSVTLAVQEVRGVELVLVESPAFVPAGQDIVALYRITNTGNTRGLFLLNPVTNMGEARVSDSAGVTLGAGESAEVGVFLPTRKSDRVQPLHLVQLETRSAEQPQMAARTSAFIEVIPVPLDGDLRRHEFPARVAGIVAGEEDRARGQLEIAGVGKPFDGKEDELEFLLRGPDNQPISTLGKRDEYRLTYDSPAHDFRVLLGDQTYRLTPLTEFGRYSFGAGLEGSLASLHGTVFAHETRLTTPRERQVGVGALYDVLPWAGVGAHYLNKSGSLASSIVGVRTVFRPDAGHTVDLEVAQSSSSGISDRGLEGRAYGRWPRLVYDVQFIRSEPNFTGYFRDMQFFSVGATVMPLADWRVEANVRMDNRNIDLNPAQPYAPAERFYLAGVGYGSFAALYLRSLSQWDRLSGRAYDRREDIAQLRLSWAAPRLSLVPLLEYGRKADRVVNRSAPYGKAALSSTYAPTIRLRLGAWIEYTTDRNLQVDANLDRTSGGASVWYSPWATTQALLTFFASRTVSFFRSTNMFLEGLIVQTLPWGHQLEARARYSYFDPAVTRTVFAFAVEYGIPLAVPLGRKRDVGRMSGRLTDYETGAGIPGALLRTDGTAALTDEAGAFMFPGLVPGTYPVEIDRASIGLNRRPMVMMPAVMTVEGGETTSLELSIVRSASIAGRVLAYGYQEEPRTSDTLLTEEGGVAEVVVELEGGGDFQRRLTNNRGEFRFPDLVPGLFVLRVQGETVPSSLRLSPDSLAVVLEAGEERSVLFSAIERKRVVRVVQQGEVRVEGAPVVPLVVESDQFQNECLLMPVPGGSGYKVQVSSWQTQAKAEAVAVWASSVSGYTSSVESVTLSGGSTRYAVRLGKVTDETEARMLCELLAELDRNRESPLPAEVSPEPPVSVQEAGADTVKPAIRFLSPERVKELLRRSGERRK